MRSYIVYALLVCIKVLSRIFYRHDLAFIGATPGDPWRDIRVVAFLNHTSLFEPIFVGAVPNRFLWTIARHGVIPAADKTIKRPVVGMIFKMVARHVVSITRERDHTWYTVLKRIDPESTVIILPEGRMRRANGLDMNGQPMTARGGIADIIDAVEDGRMLIAYSGGLHHVQIPGQVSPTLFQTVRLRLENLDIGEYRRSLIEAGGGEPFKRLVMKDMDRRRDLYCPIEGESTSMPIEEVAPRSVEPS